MGQTRAMIGSGAGSHLERFLSVRRFVEIDSTNRWMREAVQQGILGDVDVAIADTQTAGRGRLDRQWVAPPLSGLLMSVLVRPSPVRLPIEKWPLVSFAMAMAVREAAIELLRGVRGAAGAETVGGSIGVKWPNDVVVRDLTSPTGYRKLSGILVESVKGCLVVGVGVNVTRPDLKSDDLGVAALPIWMSDLLELGESRGVNTAGGTGVADRTPQTDDGHARSAALSLARDQCADAVLRHFALQLESLEGELDTFLEHYRNCCITLNQSVTADVSGEHLVGVAQAIARTGEIIVRTAHGDRQLSVSEVTHIRPT